MSKLNSVLVSVVIADSPFTRRRPGGRGAVAGPALPYCTVGECGCPSVIGIGLLRHGARGRGALPENQPPTAVKYGAKTRQERPRRLLAARCRRRSRVSSGWPMRPGAQGDLRRLPAQLARPRRAGSCARAALRLTG